MAADTQTGNRILFYALLTPVAYTIFYQQTSGDNMLMDFPSQAMMDEVLALVSPTYFYLGNGVWWRIERTRW